MTTTNSEVSLPTVAADTNDWESLVSAQGQNWIAKSSRGYEVLTYDAGHEVLGHPDLPKGPTFLKRLDMLGIVDGPIREEWSRIVTTTEGDERRRLRIPLAGLFRPAQIAKLQLDVRQIVKDCLDEVEDLSNVDLMQELAWKVPSRVYCLLVSAPVALAPMAARMSDSILTPLLTVNTDRRQESIDAFQASLDFVREHIDARRKDLGEDFTSVMIRQQMEGLLTEEELVAEGAGILQASIDNTAHQAGLVLATLLKRPSTWAQLRGNPALVPQAVEEVIRLEPRFNTIFRHAPADVTLRDQLIPAGSWVYVSARTAQRDPAEFQNPGEFRLDRPRFRPLMFGGGGYNCLGQHLARMEFHEIVQALLTRFPDTRLAEDVELRYSNAITEVASLRATLA
jgi:cytochrome P450